MRVWLKKFYKSEMVDCELRSISDIILENNLERIDLLKVDAENYEREVLRGINGEDWDKIRQISMEVHTHIKGGENLLDEIVELLNEKAFQVDLDLDSRFGIMGVYMLYAKKIL